jgi:hypothetical protein
MTPNADGTQVAGGPVVHGHRCTDTQHDQQYDYQYFVYGGAKVDKDFDSKKHK